MPALDDLIDSRQAGEPAVGYCVPSAGKEGGDGRGPRVTFSVYEHETDSGFQGAARGIRARCATRYVILLVGRVTAMTRWVRELRLRRPHRAPDLRHGRGPRRFLSVLAREQVREQSLAPVSPSALH